MPYNVLRLKEVADLTDKTMNGEQNLIQVQNFIRGTKPAISFKVPLYADAIFYLCSLQKTILIF